VYVIVLLIKTILVKKKLNLKSELVTLHSQLLVEDGLALHKHSLLAYMCYFYTLVCLEFQNNVLEIKVA